MNSNVQNEKDALFLKVSIENIQGGIVATIGLREYAVLQVIASYTNNEGKCFPNQETLAEVCGVSKRQMIRLIDNLCEIRIDGNPILLRETKREGEKKTKNYYTVLPLAGMAFGSNKVVSKMSPRKDVKDVAHCEETSEGSDKIGKEVVTKRVKGSVKNVTLTKAIELNPLELNPLEQDIKESAASFVEKNNDPIQDNKGNDKDSKIVDIDKESNEAKEEKAIIPQSHIVGESEGKRITSSIVAIGRSKNEIGEDNESCSSAAGTGTASSQSEPLSVREQTIRLKEMYRKAREADEIKKHEERQRKSREEAAAWGLPWAMDGVHTASEDASRDKRPSVPQTPVQAKNDPYANLSFEELLASMNG